MKNLKGLRVGLLTIMDYSHRHTHPGGAKVHYWKVRCDCGKEFTRKATHLTSRKIKGEQSCGCAIASQTSKRFQTHGLKNSRSYDIWKQMIYRCEKLTNKDYKYYGARGIKVCRRWHSVQRFIKDMGERPAFYSLERVDVNRGYCKANCKWIPIGQQSRNTRSNIRIKHNGETLILADWAKKLGCGISTLSKRLKAGWSKFETVTIPILK